MNAGSIRIDKWLWAARFFKTRSLAQQALDGGKVKLNGERAKPAKDVKAGDKLDIRVGDSEWAVTVLQTSAQRGPATVARELYEESAESAARRAAALANRRDAHEPAARRLGRPTKRERRDLDRWKDSDP